MLRRELGAQNVPQRLLLVNEGDRTSPEPELALGLLQALMASEQGDNMASAVEKSRPGLRERARLRPLLSRQGRGHGSHLTGSCLEGAGGSAMHV